MTVKDIEINSEKFKLHPSGAVFWERRSMLLIADVHLGKATHFRKHGIAVPEQAMYTAYEKLDTLCDTFQPKTICFLGDLFHSYINNEWKLFQSWVRTVKPRVVLVTGNHDIIPEHKLEKLNIAIKDEWVLDEFLLTHEPANHPELFNLCGHIHPGIRLKGPAKQTLKLPCFFRKTQQLILPAFGEFTGKYLLTPDRTDRVYAVTPEEVILVSGE